MRKSIILIGIISCLFALKTEARTITVSGLVTDKKTKEILIGANITYNESSIGAFTNSYGFYSLRLPAGAVSLSCSYIGYEPVEFSFELHRDTTINMELSPGVLQLSELTVTSGKGGREDMGIVNVPIPIIKNTPSFFGESDLMKSLLYIPGVRNSAEGKSDLTIRGGSPDQNLILLDGIPVYNAGHAFGFFSIFNTETIKKVTLYKSGYPARFGSRLSSVIDIHTKDGNKGTFSGSATLGLIAANINIEGPVVKDKTSFFFSARRSLADLYLSGFQKLINDEDSKNDRTNIIFHDINAKIHHRIGDKNALYLMAYNGRDKQMNKTGYVEYPYGEISGSMSKQDWEWGNTIYAVRLNSAIASNMFLNATLAYNGYRYQTSISDLYTVNGKEIVDALDYLSGIDDYSVSINHEYVPSNNHFLRSGFHIVFHEFRPEVLDIRSDGNEPSAPGNLPRRGIHSKEYSFYIEDEWDMAKELRMNMGFRVSSSGTNGVTYTAFDPRLSLRYMLTEKISLSADYTHMEQFIHMLSNNSILLQTDLWVPSTASVKPMRSRQYALGFNISVTPQLTFSAGSYYKDMDNVIEYKEGASFMGNSSGWENKVESGIGRAYGMELALEKNRGKTTGSLSYTLSKTERKFNGINDGGWFPSKYDRRHSINTLVSHKLNAKTDFTLNWTYSSGNMMTIPFMTAVTPDIPFYPIPLGELTQLDRRNNYRMPAFHRLDIGMNYTPKIKENRYGIWNFSIYNVYNRLNSFKIFVETDVSRNHDGEVVYTKKLKQVSFLPVMPSVSYTYKF